MSPIYVDPKGEDTNVPPVGDDDGWSLAQGPNVSIPGRPAPHKKKQSVDEYLKNSKKKK